MTRRARSLTLAVTLITALAGACGRGRAVDEAPLEPQGAVSDALLQALGEAQNLHHTADVQVARGDMDGAIRTLERVVALPFPPGAAEAEDVHMDGRARLALVLAQAGRLDDAERVVDEGLASATRDSFFVANLHQVRGKLWEARARAMAAEPAAEHAAKRKAIEAYERAQQMNFRVQDRLYKETLP